MKIINSYLFVYELNLTKEVSMNFKEFFDNMQRGKLNTAVVNGMFIQIHIFIDIIKEMEAEQESFLLQIYLTEHS